MTAIFFVWSMICPLGFAETIDLEGGSVEVNVQDNVTNVGVTGNPVWNVNQFNVAQGSIYNLTGLTSGASLAMLVNGGSATNILGTMNLSNLIFILQNVYGINVGATGIINLNNASLLASTLPLNLKATDFLNQKYQFSGDGGFLSNAGRITGNNAELVALIANAIENSGTIDVPMGEVVLAAGKTVTIGLSGDGLISVAVDKATVNAMGLNQIKDQIKNTGTISANGGMVSLTAKAADKLFEKAINIAKEDNATGAVIADDGKIEFVADGDVRNAGVLQAKRGSITIDTGGTIENSAVINTKTFREHGYTFHSTGTIEGGKAYYDNIDGAATISGNIGSDQSDTGNLIVTGDITLTTDNLTFTADSDSDGSGVFYMNSSYTINGVGFSLTIKTGSTAAAGSGIDGQGPKLGSFSNMNLLTLDRSSGTPTYTSDPTTTTWDIDDFRMTSGTKLNRFTGSGTVEAPYQIHDVYGLQAMDGFLSSVFKLANNINAASTSGWNSGAGFAPVSTFTGTFDGQGYTISSLYINRPSTNYVGLFGQVNHATIRDVGLTNVDITGQDRVGGLVGYSRYLSMDRSYVTGSVLGISCVGGLVGQTVWDKIHNSYFNGSVTGEAYVGGLAGLNTGTKIHTSYFTGSISGYSYVGGLVGYNFGEANINNSYATGTVNGLSYVGGLVGCNLNSSIDNSYATSYVVGVDHVGGLVGRNLGSSIDDSYATGEVTGWDYVGGLTGENNDSSSINNSYATGKLIAKGDMAGGLVGYNNSNIRGSYAIGAVTGVATNKGGLVGFNGSSGSVESSFYDSQTTGQSDEGKGTPLLTQQMQDKLTFIDLWDFNGLWKIDESNSGYPHLIWQDMDDGSGFIGGTSAHPFQISDVNQLQFMMYDLDGYFQLASDIDASHTEYWNHAMENFSGFVPVGSVFNRFSGTFDGQGHTITELYIYRPNENYVGLFGYTKGTTIQDVGLTGVKVNGLSCVGGLAGYSDPDSNIDNAFVKGTVFGAGDVGGLVGTNNGTITNSYSSGNVSGSGYNIGGLVGHNFGTITGSYATANISADATTVGGFVGANDGIISDSYATGNVTVNGDNVGGFAGYMGSRHISNSYSTGIVSASGNQVGGFVGWQECSSLINSFSASKVSGNNNVGGLVGFQYYANVDNSYFTDNSHGDQTGKGTYEAGGPSAFFSPTHPVYTNPGAEWDFGAMWHSLQSSFPLMKWEVNVWKAADSGLWSNPANWSKGRAPTAGDTVLFDSTSKVDAAIDAFFSGAVNKLYIDTGYTGTISQESSLAVAGVYSQAAGTFRDTAPLSHDFTAGSFSVPLSYDGAFNRYTGGGDKQSDPYLIRDIYDLQAMRSNLSSHFRLSMKDVDEHNVFDASMVATWNNGKGFAPIGTKIYDENGNLVADYSFLGSLDGKGYTIRHLTMKRSEEDYTGFLGSAGSGATIHDFELRDTHIEGRNVVGGFAGWSAAEFWNVAINGADTVIGANFVGGFFGKQAQGGSLTNAITRVNVIGDETVGLAVGLNEGMLDQIIAAYATLTVNTPPTGILVGEEGPTSVVTRSFYDLGNSGQSDSLGPGTAAKTPKMIADGFDESGNIKMIYDPEYVEDPAPDLMDSATYADWDNFGDTWVTDDGGSSLPALKVVHPNGIKAAWGYAYNVEDGTPLGGKTIALYVNHDPYEEGSDESELAKTELGEQRDLTKTSGQGNYYFEMEPDDVVSTDWVIGKIVDDVYFGNARMKAGEGSMPGLNIPGDRADILTNAYEKITVDTPPVSIPDNQSLKKAQEEAGRSLDNLMNNMDQFAASAEGVWSTASDVQIQDETLSVPGIETELPSYAGISFYNEPAPGREPIPTFTLTQVGTSTQGLRSGSTKSVMMKIAENLMHSTKEPETSGTKVANSASTADGQTDNAANATGQKVSVDEAVDQTLQSLKDESGQKAAGKDAQTGDRAANATDKASAKDPQGAGEEISSEEDAAFSKDHGIPRKFGFFGKDPEKFTTNIRVIEGAVYVVDSVNEVSFLTPGESMRVSFKNRPVLIKGKGTKHVSKDLNPRNVPVKSHPSRIVVKADSSATVVKTDFPGTAGEDSSSGGSGKPNPPPLLAAKEDLSDKEEEADLSTVSTKTNSPEKEPKEDLPAKVIALASAIPLAPREVVRRTPPLRRVSESDMVRYGILKNPGKNVFVRCVGGEWQAVVDDMVILPGDEVRTASDSSVEVLLDGGQVGRVEIKEGSLFRINKAETNPTTGDKTTLLDLAVGKLVAHVEKLQGKSKFEVKSPTLLTGVRGTVFEVTVKEKTL